MEAALRLQKNPFELRCLLLAGEVLLPDRPGPESGHALQRRLELLLKDEALHLEEILGISMRIHRLFLLVSLRLQSSP
jgi:hypothetical protein